MDSSTMISDCLGVLELRMVPSVTNCWFFPSSGLHDGDDGDDDGAWVAFAIRR